jgi:hypothetical protein
MDNEGQNIRKRRPARKTEIEFVRVKGDGYWKEAVSV